MIFRKQLFLHAPNKELGDSSIGDCFRTCVACVLDLEPETVPHFVAKNYDWDKGLGGNFAATHQALNAWLLPQKLRYIEFPINPIGTVDEQLAAIKAIFPGMQVILSCSSTNGNHSVIAGTDFWDPSIDSSGCVGPMSDGLYWVGIFVPAIPSYTN